MYENFYRHLYLIRRVEEEIAEVYPTDKIKSPIHLSIGQESVSVGVCQALQPKDIVFGTYRGHALYLAKGGNLKKMIAELFGKATGCAKGKGGSMHLIDVSVGVMGGSAVVGTIIANAVGYAYATAYQKKDSVVACFFGDGAVDEGVFHESLNFAALKKLPILFICENNFYAIHSHQRQRQANVEIWQRAAAYGIQSARITNDPLEIFKKVGKAVKAIRSSGKGPFFFECLTYRWKEHVGPEEDFHLGYRTEEERKPWVNNDHVRKVAERINTKKRKEIEEEVEEEIRQAFAFAEESPHPSDFELYTDVFKD